MTNLVGDALVSGEAKFKSRRRRHWTYVGASALVWVAVVAALNFHFKGWIKVAGLVNPQYAIAVSVALVLFMLAYVVIGHRIADEQEERAMLWASTISFYVLVTGEMAGAMLAGAGLVGPPAFMALIAVSGIVYLAVWLWLMFR
jgi:peptidoglycan/LPS O-acetylase OafA/YrhL